MKAKTRKPSRSEQLAHFTARNHKDLSSYEIQCRLSAIYSGIKDNESELSRLAARQKEIRSRLEADRAEARGLETVISSRAWS